MTTVGYGDMCASTPVGRFIAIVTIMMGSWIMAIVIAVQASLFELGKEEQLSIRDVSRQRGAVKVIIAALRLQVARSRRYRYGENEGDYQPTGPEIEELRIKMIEEAQNWKNLRDLSSQLGQDLDSEISKVREKVNMFQENFNFFVAMLIQDGKLTLNDDETVIESKGIKKFEYFA
jgi:hypothetical protein